jgi:hypothetical protein
MTPTGGDRDVQAPILKNSTPNDSSLNVQGGKFTLTFDEYIKVMEPQKNVTITPLIKTLPSFNYTKNKVTFTLDDSLLEKNTTYKISYGNAIVDMHEGNVITNLTTTFSTGVFFDSMYIKGNVLQANTGLADTNVWVALYKKNKPDSIVTIEKPLYITKCNGSGFIFENLPKLEYKIYAFKDVNNTLMYDASGETIAYLDEAITSSRGKENVTLYTFLEEKNIDTNNKLTNRLFARDGGNNVDKAKFTYTTNLDTTKKGTRSFNYFETIAITFNEKIETLQATNIRLYIDSILDANTTVELDTSKKKIFIISTLEQDANYKLDLLKGFATDSMKLIATPSTSRFKTKRDSDFGTLHVNVTNTNMTTGYILQLIQQEKVIKSEVVKSSKLQFDKLAAGTYTLRLILDENENGKWDTGNFTKKIQPEKVLNYKEPLQVKANWDNTITWTLDEKK